MEQIVQTSPGTLLHITILLNINMWIRFYYKIEGIATTLKLKNSNEDEQTIIQRQLKIIDMVTFVLVVLVIGYTIGIVADYKTYYKNKQDDFPIKKEGSKIDLDIEMIKKLIEKRKKEKKKLAMGGIAGVL